MDNLNDIPRIDKPLFYIFNGEVIRIGKCIKEVQHTQVFTGHGELYGLFTHSSGPVVHVATLRHSSQGEFKNILSTKVKQTPNEYNLSCIGEWFSLQDMKIPIPKLLRKKAETLTESERYFCIVVEQSQSNRDTEDFSNCLHAFFITKDTICKMDKKTFNRESPFRFDVDFVERLAFVSPEKVCLKPMESETVGTEMIVFSGGDNVTTDLLLPDSGSPSDPNANALRVLQNLNGHESEDTLVKFGDGACVLIAKPNSETNELSIEPVEQNTNGSDGGEDQSPDRRYENNLQKDSEIQVGLSEAQPCEENSELKTGCTKDVESMQTKESSGVEENFSAVSPPKAEAVESTTIDTIENVKDAESDEIENTAPDEFGKVTAKDLSTNEESKTVENEDKRDKVGGGLDKTVSFECKENSARDAEIETDKSETECEFPKLPEMVLVCQSGEQSLATEEQSLEAIQNGGKTNTSNKAVGTNSTGESKTENSEIYQSDKSDGKSEIKTEDSGVACGNSLSRMQDSNESESAFNDSEIEEDEGKDDNEINENSETGADESDSLTESSSDFSNAEPSNSSSSTDENQSELDVGSERGPISLECEEIENEDDIREKSNVTKKDENDADDSHKTADEENSSTPESESSSSISTSSTNESPSEPDDND